ncbi:SUKH-4 family immunity protein [Micromonospora sp. SH-82]|uniref:SUKH-4 family immunity protein n=1 Tax=Micromonospora sp. SH-82 TaxID=3132938 RepID=UPI003EC0F4BC
MATDTAAIDSALTLLRETGDTLPYPGTWLSAPRVEETGTVLAVDEGLSQLVVDAETGSVHLVDDEGAELVNSSLAAFVACAEAYRAAQVTAGAIDEEADEELEALGEQLTDRFREIDPPAVADENTLWAIAAEELGYGMI